MNNKRFFIKGFGEFEYIVTLLSVDYPETFIAKKIGKECELYVFDEVRSDEKSVSWICCAISIDELDGLNKGTRTLNSCFYGPRKTSKEGFLVTSKSGCEEASYVFINDVSKHVSDIDVYVPQFVEDNHGSGVLSLATGKVLLSVVVNDEKYADPFIDVTRLTDNANSGKSFLKSLPYNIEVKNNRACIQSNQSIVINFEISDKESEKESKQITIEQISREVDNKESLAAAKAIKKAFYSGENKEELISALGNNKIVLKKFDKFVSSISKNKNEKQIIQIIEPGIAKSEKLDLSRDNLKAMSCVAKESINIISNSNKKMGELICFGYFEMFDLKGKGKFRFIGDDGTIYRGVKSPYFDSKKRVIELKDSNTKYMIKLESTSYEIDGKRTDMSYELIEAKKQQKAIQNKLDI